MSLATFAKTYPRFIAALSACAVVLAAFAAWLLWPQSARPPEPPVVGATPAAPSREEPAGRLLASQTLSPSTAEQVVACGQALEIAVPGNALTSAATFKIYSVPHPPRRFFAGFQESASYEIDAGGQEFKEELTLRFRYDPAHLPADLSAEDALVVAYWDRPSESWVEAPLTIDEAAHVAMVRTSHLSPWTLFELLAGYTAASSEHFRIRFSKDSNAAGLGAREIFGYVAKVRALLEKSYGKYAAAGFTQPKNKTSVYVVPRDDSEWGWFSKRIRITTQCYDDTATEHEVAHELFHHFQNQDVYVPTMILDRWWLEATADYAADKVVLGTGHMGKTITARYLEEPLTSVNDKHEYWTAHFLDYLVGRGANFKDMWSYVAERQGFSVTDNLSKYLQTALQSSLEAQYAGFARYFVFDPDSPMPTQDKAKVSPEAGEWILLKEDEKEAEHTFNLPADWTARLWKVRVKTTQAGATRRFRIGELERLPVDTELDIYVLKDDVRRKDLTPVATILPHPALFDEPWEKQETSVDITQNDALYVLAINVSRKDQGIKVKLYEDEVSLRIVPSQPKGVAGARITFDVESTGVPHDAAFRWDFGDGLRYSGLSTSRPSYVFASPGAYTVSVHVWWNGARRAGTSITFEVEPGPPEPERAEVSFYVSRKYTSTLLDETFTERQACQKYAIKIYRKGVPVNTATDEQWSIGRNGEYSIMLQVGEEYTYEIEYDAYQPRNSGKRSGTFTVVKGQDNHITVETDPYREK